MKISAWDKLKISLVVPSKCWKKVLMKIHSSFQSRTKMYSVYKVWIANLYCIHWNIRYRKSAYFAFCICLARVDRNLKSLVRLEKMPISLIFQRRVRFFTVQRVVKNKIYFKEHFSESKLWQFLKKRDFFFVFREKMYYFLM